MPKPNRSSNRTFICDHRHKTHVIRGTELHSRANYLVGGRGVMPLQQCIWAHPPKQCGLEHGGLKNSRFSMVFGIAAAVLLIVAACGDDDAAPRSRRQRRPILAMQRRCRCSPGRKR